MSTAPPSTWLARLLFTLTLAAAALLILVVILAPLLDNDRTVPTDWQPVVRLFARDGTVRRTAVASSLGLLVTACLFFRPTDGGVRRIAQPPAAAAPGHRRRVTSRGSPGMPSWLVEDPTPVYILLAVAAVVLAAAYWNRRKRSYLLGIAGVLLLAGVVWLIDFLVVTERERLTATVASMGRALHALDTDRVFQHISDGFEYGGMKKGHFQENVRSGIRVFQVRDMQIWGVEIRDVDPEKRTAKVEFYAKAKGNWSGGADYYLVEADFVLEQDGQWRMRNFTLHNPFANTREPIGIPLPR